LDGNDLIDGIDGIDLRTSLTRLTSLARYVNNVNWVNPVRRQHSQSCQHRPINRRRQAAVWLLRQKNLGIFRELGCNWRIFLKQGSISKNFFQTERIRAQLPPKKLVVPIGEKLCKEDEYRFFWFGVFLVCVGI
jgi:hypothetical protein